MHNCSLLEGSNYVRKPSTENSLYAGNRDQVTQEAKSPLDGSSLLYLCSLIGEVLDLSASGEDIFLSIGANRAKNAFVLTVTWAGTKMYAPGLTLLAVAEASGSLLEDA